MAAGDSRAIARRVASRRANRESRSRVARARSVAFCTHPRDARPRSRARYCGRARATAREPGRRFARGDREGVANREHGTGTMTCADGQTYEGEWVEGMKQGRGVMTTAEGERYEGGYLVRVLVCT